MPRFVLSGLTRQLCAPHIERLGAFHASQCGYCTPGFTVAMHGVLREAQERNAAPTANDFQAGLDGNLCRCTGYRPIIDACKVRVWWVLQWNCCSMFSVPGLGRGWAARQSPMPLPLPVAERRVEASAVPSQLQEPSSRDVAL